MNLQRPRMVGAILAIAAALTPCAFTQTVVTGDIAGSVTDASGAVIPTSALTLKSSATGETKTANTGKNGDFRFALLRPGTYSLSVTAKGFATSEKQVDVSL